MKSKTTHTYSGHIKTVLAGSKELFLLLSFMLLITMLVLYKVVFIANISSFAGFWTLYGLIATTFLISRVPFSFLHDDNHSHTYTATEYPTVTIIIAAKDEEDGIFKTIGTCVESNYPAKVECIVIDDGSTDNTGREVLKAEAKYGRELVRLITFPTNKGKREAMAIGIKQALHEIIVFVDSDSFLEPNALQHITEHFLADPTIGAVAGNTKVSNAGENFLTKMQSIKYSVSFDIYKASESLYHAVTCCPGCFSAYRLSAVQPLVDAWKNHTVFGTKSTFGDDRGLTNYVLQSWKIVYCEKARASTKAPTSFRVYMKQQLRWKKSWIREGTHAASFMWKRTHPLASLGFYINFTFPILGPILAGMIIWKSISSGNPLLLILFITGFVLLGVVFAIFARLRYRAENWLYMPVFSLLFITIFIWQMPYALLTLNKTSWGTR